MSTELDILVPTHNHLELTIQCIDAIYRYTSNPFHLIVMDDSTDLTPAYFESFSKEHPNLTYYHADPPFTSANQRENIGLSLCKTPYVALIVNSLTVEPEWDIAGLQVMKTTTRVGLIGFKILKYPSGLIESAGLSSTGDNSNLVDIGTGVASHRLSKVYECEAVPWAFVLMRKEAVMGNLDETLYEGFKGWEDLDACFVLREKGWRILYCGLGVGYHRTRATRDAENQKDIISNLKNREIFNKRWGYWEVYHKNNPQIEEFFPERKTHSRLEWKPNTVAGVTRTKENLYKAGVV